MVLLFQRHRGFQLYFHRRGVEEDENGNFEENGRVSGPVVNTIVKSAVKEELSDMNVSADFYDALDEEVSELLDDAARRADDNDRKTVQPRDL